MGRLLPSESVNSVTTLLIRWRDGDCQALEQLMPLVYTELRRMASRHLRGERGDHTLQSTALVHEAYLRLAGQDPPQWQNRAHFFAIAARLMRQILVDHARSRDAKKRGNGVCTLVVDETIALPQQVNMDVLDL